MALTEPAQHHSEPALPVRRAILWLVEIEDFLNCDFIVRHFGPQFYPVTRIRLRRSILRWKAYIQGFLRSNTLI
jgi:hypothetical protein